MATFYDDQATARSAIKDEAGVTNNTNIGNSTIDKYQLSAYGEIFGVVAAVYDITKLVNSSSDFTSSPAQDVLTQIEALLAAGHLLKRELGTQSFNRTTIDEGNSKEKEARGMLKMIVDGEIRLYKASGAEFTRQGSGSVSAPVVSTSTYTRRFTASDTY